MAADNQGADNWDPKTAFINLSASLEQPDKFAEIFCAAAKKQKNIDATLKDIMKSLIQHDNETRKEIKEILREIDREHVIHIIKKVYTVGGAITLLIIGAILEALAHKYLG